MKILIQIWISCVLQNMRAATMFWPGSEAEIKGTRPTYYEAYDSSVTLASKVAKVLEWMDMPCKTRPIFTALYIPDVDHAGHEQGPDSLQVNETLSFVDSHLKSLLFGLESRSILKNMNIIIVSDHGMASSHSDRVRFIDDYIDLTNVKVIENGPIFMLYPTSSKQFDLLEQGALRDGNFQVLDSRNMPLSNHYKNLERISPIVLVADFVTSFDLGLESSSRTGILRSFQTAIPAWRARI